MNDAHNQAHAGEFEATLLDLLRRPPPRSTRATCKKWPVASGTLSKLNRGHRIATRVAFLLVDEALEMMLAEELEAVAASELVGASGACERLVEAPGRLDVRRIGLRGALQTT